jgi:CRISPR type III-A/MTUBE-associated protein Csm6
MKKILFSPIGGTDPISNYRDGAMLHICRVYQPDYVYLYLSKEMLEFHRKDNRYQYCLDRLGEQLGHHFEVEYIEREDLVEVQVFDSFMEEYREILQYIVKKHPNSTYYLNVSSGTPAMKSSLQILSVLSDVKMIPIQVKTPVEMLNPHLEDRTDYDVEIYWECNNDNEAFENRCKESKGQNLLDQIKKQIIEKHILAYDYVAALSVAEQLVKPLSKKTMAYLQAARWRQQLNIYGIQKELCPYQGQILPIKNEKYRNIFEHLLNLQVKLSKEEYVDFVRGLTPVIADFFQMALKQYGGINYVNYVRKDRKGIERWDLKKINQNQQLNRTLSQAFHGQFKEGPVYSSTLVYLIEEFSENEKIKQLSREIRDIETNTRNLPAHEIVSVTKDWIVKHSKGYQPEEILEMLKEYAMMLDMGVKKEDWNSYDQMNEEIIRLLKRE